MNSAMVAGVISLLLVGAERPPNMMAIDPTAVEPLAVDPSPVASDQGSAFNLASHFGFGQQAHTAAPCHAPMHERQFCHDLQRRCYRPLWTIEAGAITLDREASQSIPFVVAPGGAVLAGEADLGFGFDAGFFISLVRHTDSAWDVEATHFNVAGWNANSIFGAVPDGSSIPFAAPAIAITGNVGPNTLWYQSELFSTEINARRYFFEDWHVLAGFRIVELHERFAGGLQGPASLAVYTADSDNFLYGFQMGVGVDLWSYRRFNFDTVLKMGVYGNSVDHNSLLVEPVGSVILGPAEDRAGHAAFLGEMVFNFDYQLTEYIGLSAAYRLMWIEGLALAMEQIPVTDFTTNNGVSAGGNSLFHGINLGFTVTW